MNRAFSGEKESELIEKLVDVNRVAKVVKGGRRFSFAAIVIVGDGKGKVGYGTGKASEVPDAVRKATEQAKRNLTKIPLKEGRTLHHDVFACFGAAKVVLRSAPPGTGIIAGGPMRPLFEALGIHDITSKSLGSSNPQNVIRTTFKALKKAKSPRQIAFKRGKKVADIVGYRDVNFEGINTNAN